MSLSAIATPMKTLASIIGCARRVDSESDCAGNTVGCAPVRESGLLRISRAEEKLSGLLSGVGDETLTELLALVWVARGDFSGEDWDEALACARKAKNERLATYLSSTERLGDLLESGLAELNSAAD